MSQFFSIHPDNPQPRLIRQAVAIIRDGGVIVLPTDSCYALGCHIGDKAAMERIRAIRGVDARHHFGLVCRDLAEAATYARIDDRQFRLIKAATPGSYTFILQATREVPRRLLHPRRKTIGVRIPAHRVVHALLAELGEPLLSSTLILPGRRGAAERCGGNSRTARAPRRSDTRQRFVRHRADHRGRSDRSSARHHAPGQG